MEWSYSVNLKAKNDLFLTQAKGNLPQTQPLQLC